MFRSRSEAGQELGALLARYAAERPVVLALPRGGVPVGFEIARALGCPLDVLVVRKLGAPHQPEFGFGAVAEGEALFLEPSTVSLLGLTNDEIQRIVSRERLEVRRRVAALRGGRPPADLADRTAIVVDDGVATGGTARAAILAIRQRGPRKIVFATPVAARRVADDLRPLVDDLVCAETPEDLFAIGSWYEDFRQIDDEEVVSLLARSTKGPEYAVEVQVDGITLEGDLEIPDGALGVVLFAHGSGSSRWSPRNRFVAGALHKAGLGTLLFDLLTREEESVDALTGTLRFDIDLLSRRLEQATRWLRRRPELGGRPIGYFGSSTGAAAAFLAAARDRGGISAIVSRGGRPDLAQGALARVCAPTLLIVGEQDRPVLALNRQALAHLAGEKELAIVPGATHLFEEADALEEVTRLAAEWFVRHLSPRAEAHP